jgi:hypothetical protein
MGRRPANRFARLLRFDSSKKSRREAEDRTAESRVLLEMEASSHSSTLSSSHSISSCDHEEDEGDLLTSTMAGSKLDIHDRCPTSSRKSVRFGECAVRNYSQVLGDHPYCSMGCPLELGWQYESMEKTSVDDFEAGRSHERRLPSQELRLTPEERRNILQSYSDTEVRRACRRLNRDRSIGKRQKKAFFATV